MAPSTLPTSPGSNKDVWEWGAANNLKLPAAFVVARFIKYQGGDYLQKHVSLNPDALGAKPTVGGGSPKSDTLPVLPEAKK